MCRKRTSDKMRQLGFLMNITDFSHIHEPPDPEARVEALTKSINSILDRTVKLRKVPITNNDEPWMTVQIKSFLRKRQHAFCAGDNVTYRQTKIVAAKLIKKAKYLYYKKEVEGLRHSNSRQWFKSVKSLLGMEASQVPAEQNHNTLQLQCDTLAKHFASVWEQSKQTLPSEDEVTQTFTRYFACFEYWPSQSQATQH